MTSISTAAATCIQMHCRSYLARRAYEKEKALVVIQNAWRNYAARKAVEKHLLPDSLFEKALPLTTQLSAFPKARDGKKSVYYLPDMPVVVKQCGSQTKSWQMFEEMNNARKACKNYGLKHVCVPRARTHGDLLLVKRIYFSPYTKVQIGMYLRNHACFTQAVEEFARLYFETTLPDLVDGERNPDYYKSIKGIRSNFPFCRYDNLAFYIKNGVGKLALIDVEGFSFKSDRRDSFEKCEALVSLFPLHCNEVFAAALQYNLELSRYFVLFKKQQEEILRCFKVIYRDHLHFAQRKNLRLFRPADFAVFSPTVRQKLFLYLCKKLQQENAAGPFRGCLKQDTLIQFNKIFFPRLAVEIHSFVQEHLTRQAKLYRPIQSMEELLNARTVFFNFSRGVEFLHTKLPKLDLFEIDPQDEHELLERIVYLFFKGLKKCDHIAYNKRAFGFPPYRAQCIFC